MKHLFITFLWISSTLCALANTAFDEAFQEGNRLYLEGRYTDAIASYNQALKAGASASLYFNLGNAYAKDEQSGQAILNYRRAHWLSPREPDINTNLRFARERNHIDTPPLSSLQRYTYWLSVDTWTLLLTLGVWGSVLGFFILRYTGLNPRTTRTVGILGLCLALASLPALAGWHFERNLGIITEPQTPLKVAPAENSPVKTTLSSGSETSILDSYGDYLYIKTSRDETGWVHQSQCTPLLPQT